MCTLVMPNFRVNMNVKENKKLIYPRVEDIIAKQRYGSFLNIPFETVLFEKSKENEIHRDCIELLHGSYIRNIDNPYNPYMDAWASWVSENVVEILHLSETLFDDDHIFYGTYDLICRLTNGKITLVNVKICDLGQSSWLIELAAHKRLCQYAGYSIKDALVVHLCQEDGKVVPKLHKLDSYIASWNIFEGALNCYRYFKNTEN